jgi:acetyl esterase/lipase
MRLTARHGSVAAIALLVAACGASSSPSVPAVAPSAAPSAAGASPSAAGASPSDAAAASARLVYPATSAGPFAASIAEGLRTEVDVLYTDVVGCGGWGDCAVPLDILAPTDAAGLPTVVLLHGGPIRFHERRYLDALAAATARRGAVVFLASYRSGATGNPVTDSLEDVTCAVRYARSVTKQYGGDPSRVVLVGHSYGGAVISNAARGVSNVEALVYIAAFAPDTGETLEQLVTKNPGTHITPDALDARPYPLPGGGTGIDLYIKAEVFRDAFAGDLPRKTTNLMQAEQRPFSVAAFTEPSGDLAWKTVPSWYLVVSRVAASHVPMMSQPKATMATIMRAVHAVD